MAPRSSSGDGASLHGIEKGMNSGGWMPAAARRASSVMSSVEHAGRSSMRGVRTRRSKKGQYGCAMAHPREPTAAAHRSFGRVRRDIVWLTDREYRYLNVLAAVAVPVFVLVNQPWIADKQRSRLVLSAFGIGFAFALWI